MKRRMVIKVAKIECYTCGLAIEKQVKKIKGVIDVRSASMLNKVFVDYDSNLVDSATILNAIGKTGYASNLVVEDRGDSAHAA